jgi:hypothetical protein
VHATAAATVIEITSWPDTHTHNPLTRVSRASRPRCCCQPPGAACLCSA